MKNLGNIVVLLLISLSAFAQLNVSVDKNTITRGERVSFTIKITGEGKVRLPPFDQLCGYDIEGRMQERKDVYDNGKRAQELSLIYTFMPERTCVIEPFPVTINDVEVMSEPVTVTVSKMTISKNEPFLVSLMTEKDFVYVGEPFEMSVKFQQRQTIRTLGEAISLPESKNIWIKSENKGQMSVQDRYAVRTNVYALSAQQSGKLLLGPLRWDLKVRAQVKDYWGSFMPRAKTRSVFSNELEIKVKPLPEGINIVGSLDIKAHVDKTEINAGEAVNLTIEVKGRANIEDITTFSIHLKGAQAFNEEPTISHFLQNEKYFGSLTQKSALVAQENFVIPSFSISYMDVKTDTVKTISTQEIAIQVNNQEPVVKAPLNVSRAEVVDVNEGTVASLNYLQAAFLLLGGVFLGLFIGLIPWKNLFKSEKSKSKIAVKESKEVLQLLMSNMQKDPQIESLVKQLSENLYEGKSHKIDKKALKEVLKKLQ